jgi:hypothetical protein
MWMSSKQGFLSLLQNSGWAITKLML